MEYNKLILDTIENSVKNFNDNELAYLAVTSKVENPLRDKIAYNLHRSEFLNDKIICREWKDKSNPANKNRYDLAILNKSDGSLECLVEFKADSVQKRENSYKADLENDITRLKIINNSNTEKYLVFFQNLPHNKFDNNYSPAIKYVDEINKYAEVNKSVEQTRKNYHAWWAELLKSINQIDTDNTEHLDPQKYSTFSLKAGSCFGVKIDIEGFIYGPI